MKRDFLRRLCPLLISGGLVPLSGTGQVPAALRAGPMVGYVAPTSARVWVQTTTPATVSLTLGTTDSPGAPLRRTAAVRTTAAADHIAQLRLDSLRPDTHYRYQLWLDGQPVPLPYETGFRTPPADRLAPADFTFATGSCAAVYEPYGAGAVYDIFLSIARQRPDYLLWLGDNVYLNAGEWADPGRRRARYRHTRGLPPLQPLLGNTANVAIWDDHDFGPNDADRTAARRTEAQAVFDDYWLNPPPARPEARGITTAFSWGDVDFLLLDNRSFRSPAKTPRRTRTQLGHDQVAWLLAALRRSKATFKFVAVGGQILTPNRRGETLRHHYGHERRRLLDSLQAARVPGVIFLTGDRHFTELTRWRGRRGALAYDLTVSPFTSTPDRHTGWSRWRIRGTRVTERNFATLRVSGAAGARVLTITVLGTDGAVRWTKQVPAAEWGTSSLR